MYIQFLNAPGFTIDNDNMLHRSGSWMLTADDDPNGDIALQAQAWAGSIGDAWRQPSDTGDSYEADPEFSVTQIKCQALDSKSCIVTFEASAVQKSGLLEAVSGSCIFERCCDLSEHKTIQYILSNSNIDTLPQVGDVIDWAGSNYRCESLNCRIVNQTVLHVTLKAVNTAVTPDGRIVTAFDNDHGQTKKGSWLITPEALEDFLNRNQLNMPALWAGENYYISSVQTEPADSARCTSVTLTARNSELKLLEVMRSEEIVCMADMQQPEKLFIWNSVWRASDNDRLQFEAMLGESAESWTNDPHAIVSKVTPRRISDCEFEYLLEARYPESIDISGIRGRYWRDRDLPDRHEYYTRVGELRFSPRQCGYRYSYNGHYRKLKTWQPEALCPLRTSDPLPLNWVNQPVKLLEIVEVTYLHGTSAKNLEDITPWFTESRISSSEIAGVSGSFLRYDLDVDDITDNRGREWTRITKVYRKAPENYTWNSNYWV